MKVRVKLEPNIKIRKYEDYTESGNKLSIFRQRITVIEKSKSHIVSYTYKKIKSSVPLENGH